VIIDLSASSYMIHTDC